MKGEETNTVEDRYWDIPDTDDWEIPSWDWRLEHQKRIDSFGEGRSELVDEMARRHRRDMQNKKLFARPSNSDGDWVEDE